MSAKVNVHEVKTQLSKLLSRVEKIIICKSGKPIACLHPLEIKADRRIPGSAKGKVVVAENFDEPLPQSIFGGNIIITSAAPGST
jgi:antitoxin (DNA-binding transcriptional repressor) of toxin-antitoxin stability system